MFLNISVAVNTFCGIYAVCGGKYVAFKSYNPPWGVLKTTNCCLEDISVLHHLILLLR